MGRFEEVVDYDSNVANWEDDTWDDHWDDTWDDHWDDVVDD